MNSKEMNFKYNKVKQHCAICGMNTLTSTAILSQKKLKVFVDCQRCRTHYEVISAKKGENKMQEVLQQDTKCGELSVITERIENFLTRFEQINGLVKSVHGKFFQGLSNPIETRDVEETILGKAFIKQTERQIDKLNEIADIVVAYLNECNEL